jgi:flagellar protein FlbD
MIFVTRLDGREVVINVDLIITIEKTPDTVLTLTTGDRIMVREPVEEVVQRAIAYHLAAALEQSKSPNDDEPENR